MSSSHSSWYKRKILYHIPGLYKKCPSGNYHLFYHRFCICMMNEHCGNDGGIYNFSQGYWIRAKDNYFMTVFPKTKHIDSEYCWCDPYLDYEDPETGNQVWVHRGLQ